MNEELLAIVEGIILTDKQIKQHSDIFNNKANLNSTMQNLKMNSVILEEALVERAEEAGYEIEYDEDGYIATSDEFKS